MDVEIKKIQKCCLDIVKDIDRVCREHGIRYSLCGGSVIVAHLYKGFIPWDDDIDLMMTRENYDKFLKIYPKYAKKRYHLHHYSTDGTKNLPALFSRVEDMNTVMTEEIARGIRKGHAFVDITVFDNTSGRCYNRFIHILKIPAAAIPTGSPGNTARSFSRRLILVFYMNPAFLTTIRPFPLRGNG